MASQSYSVTEEQGLWSSKFLFSGYAYTCSDKDKSPIDWKKMAPYSFIYHASEKLAFLDRTDPLRTSWKSHLFYSILFSPCGRFPREPVHEGPREPLGRQTKLLKEEEVVSTHSFQPCGHGLFKTGLYRPGFGPNRKILDALGRKGKTVKSN